MSQYIHAPQLIYNKIYINNHTPIYTRNITLRQGNAKRVKMIDINSLYPFSLINKLPTSQGSKSSTITYYKLLVTPPNFQKVPVIYINNHTPIYTQQYTLNYLKKNNYQITIKQSWKNKYTTNMFTDSIINTYKKKHTHTHTTKLILNSLYGKLFQKEKSRPLLITSTMLQYASILIHKLKSTTNNPPCYSDTDSLFTRHPLPQKVSKSIGHAKTSTLDKLLINRVRNYTYATNNGRQTIHKGAKTYLNGEKNKLPKNLISLIRFIYNMYNYKHISQKVPVIYINNHTPIYTPQQHRNKKLYIYYYLTLQYKQSYTNIHTTLLPKKYSEIYVYIILCAPYLQFCQTDTQDYSKQSYTNIHTPLPSPLFCLYIIETQYTHHTKYNILPTHTIHYNTIITTNI